MIRKFQIGDRVKLNEAARTDPTIMNIIKENIQGIIVGKTDDPKIFEVKWDCQIKWDRWHQEWLQTTNPNDIEFDNAISKWEKYFASPG